MHIHQRPLFSKAGPEPQCLFQSDTDTNLIPNIYKYPPPQGTTSHSPRFDRRNPSCHIDGVGEFVDNG
jgi:hypothetical protein